MTRQLISLEVLDPALPLTELENVAISLREDVEHLRSVAVMPFSSAQPKPGEKGTAVEMAGLVVALGGAGALLPTLVKTVGDWLSRQRPTTKIRVKVNGLEFEWEGSSPPEEIVESIVTKLRRVEE